MKENLIVFIDSVMQSGRKIVITSLFLLGTFFAASLSYQSEATLKQINTESISLSSQDAENLMQLVLDGVLLISVITIAIYVLALKIRPENFKDFILIAKRNKLKVFGFITASVLLFLLPYNIITMGAVLLVKIIWSTIAETYEHMSHFLVKNASFPSFTEDSNIIFQDPKMERHSDESERILTGVKKELYEANQERAKEK